MITHSHNSSLAVAAIVVSIVAAITGLALTNNIRLLPEARRKAVIVMSAFLLGGGIWSMHFLAMLAIEFNVPIHYDLLQTLSSGLIAVLVAGFSLLLLHFRDRTRLTLNVAGLCLGVGIVSMHLVGMLGMRGIHPDFNSAALVVAFLLALVMGVAAVRVSYGSRSRQNIVKGGVLFGLCVVVVHHTAMIGTHFSIDPDYRERVIALDQSALAIVVTIAVFVICGTFLLAAATFGPLANPIAAPVTSDENIDTTNIIEEGKALERSPAHVSDSTNTNNPEPDTPDAELLPVKIPYEQHKKILFIDCKEVGAIRADGRYTQLYTTEGVKFCPWSITEAEKRLAGTRFYRSHRSYLINMLSVSSFEKNRDSGICRFEGFTQLSTVPVSRSRVAELAAELGI